MTQAADLWEGGPDLTGPIARRRQVVLSDEHLTVARIVYQPGESNEFHYHDGTSQAHYVVRGTFTVRTRHADGRVTETTLREGQGARVGDREREQFVNASDAPALICQVLRPGIEGVRENAAGGAPER